MTIVEQLRATLRAKGMSINAISRESGVDKAVVCRFFAGHSLTGNNIDRLCNYLGMELRERSQA